MRGGKEEGSARPLEGSKQNSDMRQEVEDSSTCKREEEGGGGVEDNTDAVLISTLREQKQTPWGRK